jgi:hypothetical protein
MRLFTDHINRPYKARDYEGVGGPEDKERMYEEENPGNDDVTGNVRQGKETVRPAGQIPNQADLLEGVKNVR